MLFRWRKYISILALAVFLFPQLVEGAHSFAHLHDIHCNEKADHHFHSLEHHCAVCDFDQSVSDTAYYISGFTVDSIPKTVYKFFNNFNVVLVPPFHFSLRGPPTVS